MVMMNGANNWDRESGLDLRRRHKRDFAEILTARATWLLPEDHRLIGSIYTHGMTAQAVAQLRGESPRKVRSRVHRLVDRMMSDRFEFVLTHREGWLPTRRRIATSYVLQGRPMRSTARHLHLSLHVVRRQVDVINALYESQR